MKEVSSLLTHKQKSQRKNNKWRWRGICDKKIKWYNWNRERKNESKEFKKVTNITGVVLTKLDSTAKGGIVLAIKEEVGIPVKYIGFGEKDTDLEVFDLDKSIYGLFKGLI